MNTSIKFEIGKSYRDCSAYGAAFFVYDCIARTDKTVKLYCRNTKATRTFKPSIFKGREIIRKEHIYADMEVAA